MTCTPAAPGPHSAFLFQFCSTVQRCIFSFPLYPDPAAAGQKKRSRAPEWQSRHPDPESSRLCHPETAGLLTDTSSPSGAVVHQVALWSGRYLATSSKVQEGAVPFISACVVEPKEPLTVTALPSTSQVRRQALKENDLPKILLTAKPGPSHSQHAIQVSQDANLPNKESPSKAEILPNLNTRYLQ